MNGSAEEIPDSVYSGTEEFFSYFSQAQIGLSTLRLSLEDRIVAPTTDLASSLEITKRTFQHNGKVRTALQDVNRLSSQLQQRIQMWEREVQNRERNKHSASGGQNQRLRAEIGQVRVRAQGADRIMAKLLIILYQMDAEKEDAEKATSSQVTTNIESQQLEASTESSKIGDQNVKGPEATRQTSSPPSADAPTSLPDTLIDSSFVDSLNALTTKTPLRLKVDATATEMEQAWDSDQLLVIVGSCSTTVEEKAGSLRLWNFPKSIEYSVVIAQQIQGISCEASVADYQAQFKLELARADKTELPRSSDVVKLVSKIIAKRFSDLPASMNLIVGHASGGHASGRPDSGGLIGNSVELRFLGR